MSTKVSISEASKALCVLEAARTEAAGQIQTAMLNLIAADASIATAIANRDTMRAALSKAIDFRDAIDAKAQDIIRVAQEDNGHP